MSMRDFLDGECGQNPVLKVASHFTKDIYGSGSTRNLNPLESSRHDLPLLPPTTFQMNDLLKEIQSLGESHAAVGPIQAPPIAELAMHPEWAKEFLKQEQLTRESETQESWTRDYMSKELELDYVWDQASFRNDGSYPPNLVHNEYVPSHFNFATTSDSQKSAQELLDDSKWTNEYVSAEDIHHLEKTELMATAEEFLKSVSDPKIRATEFMSFVEKLSSGEIDSQTGQTSDSKSKEWASEYQNSLKNSEESVSGNWRDEFLMQESGAVGGNDDSKEMKDFWQKMNEEWEKLAENDSPTHPWLSDTSASKVNEPYQFSEENTFKELENPFEEGKKRLAAGDIPSAALLFEAAVLKYPDHVESWAYLGTTQALNEQDILSIAALNKCLEFQPNDLNVLMSLATSLTNESYHLQACNVLKRWLKYNDKYSHLITEELKDSLPETASILPGNELLKVQQLFIQAARLNASSSVDPDVQCGLGILFNLGSDFDKAADCFQSALGVNPENALMWNRLGATLANGNKSSEAIGAYRRALELSPGYVRARYNLGIACIGLGAYREAAEHFLTSLHMQANGKISEEVKQKSSKMSDSIWSSMRTALHLLDMTPLTRFVDKRDLDGLSQEFNQRSY